MQEAAFFHDCLNLDYSGMEKIKLAVEQEDYEQAKHQFAQYIRNTLQPDRFFRIPYEIPENVFKFPEETDEQACERIINERTLISVGVPLHFGKDRPVDWFANPTDNQYKEWTWQLSRHNDIKMMAHQYRQNQDPRYAKTAISLIESWIRQAPCPAEASGWETECWRTIECGIRMGANWPYILFSFYQSEDWTDQFLFEWYCSVWEHGNRLFRHFTHGNWMIMEMNGLAHIGILYPQFRQSELWLETAFEKLSAELERQFYPDGFHYELTTCYHEVAVNNYQRLIETARAFDVPVPLKMLHELEKAYALNLKLMMPDGRLPDINDGKKDDVRTLLIPKQRIIGDNSEINWLVSQGSEGQKPGFLSIALPYSGFFIMRNSWSEDATWAIFDAAPFGRGHQHEDKLSLMVYANRKLLITEGGNYAYDDSEMRKYVLSTRAHNTIRVDQNDQNRRSEYRWLDKQIKDKVKMFWNIGTNYDYAEACYEERYGEAITDVVHQRNVYFVKNIDENIAPFFVVVDRIKSQDTHDYELLWHIDSAPAEQTNYIIRTKDMDIFLSAPELQTKVICEQTTPEWQGFVATGTEQGMYRSVPCISAKTSGNYLRAVSILSPHSKESMRIQSLQASHSVDDNRITITAENGKTFLLNEEEMKTDV